MTHSHPRPSNTRRGPVSPFAALAILLFGCGGGVAGRDGAVEARSLAEATVAKIAMDEAGEASDQATAAAESATELALRPGAGPDVIATARAAVATATTVNDALGRAEHCFHNQPDFGPTLRDPQRPERLLALDAALVRAMAAEDDAQAPALRASEAAKVAFEGPDANVTRAEFTGRAAALAEMGATTDRYTAAITARQHALASVQAAEREAALAVPTCGVE